MKIVAVLIALASVGLVFAIAFMPRGDAGMQNLPADSYVVKGEHTLASLAEEIGKPESFSYDPSTGIATTVLTLIVEGRLQLGDPDDPTRKETLEMATAVCGDLSLEVREQGELAIYHSAIATQSRIIQYGACTQGYGLMIDGKLTMDHGTIQYMSDRPMSWGLRKTASADLRDSSFTECDGPAMRFESIDGAKLRIERCSFGSTGEWGVVAAGDGKEPIQIVDSVLDARVGPVLMSMGEPVVKLIDCSFDKSKINFTRKAGRIEVGWTLTVVVEPNTDNQSVEGLRVVANSAEGCGRPEGPIEAVTDQDGKARLVLTEWVALPDAAKFKAGVNNSTPHVIKVYAPDAAEPIAVSESPISIRGKNQEAPIRIDGTKIASYSSQSPSLASRSD